MSKLNEERFEMMATCMKTAEGRELLKAMFRKYNAPEVAESLCRLVDGEIRPEEADDEIEDGVLDALSAGIYDTDDAELLLSRRKLNGDEVKGLREKHGLL